MWPTGLLFDTCIRVLKLKVINIYIVVIMVRIYDLKTGFVSVFVCFHVNCSNMFNRFLLLFKQVSACISW